MFLNSNVLSGASMILLSLTLASMRLLLIRCSSVKCIYGHIYKRTDKSCALSLLKTMKLRILAKQEKR